MAKRDKKDYVEKLAEEAEEAAARQDLKTLYSISKTLGWIQQWKHACYGWERQSLIWSRR